VFDFAHAEAKQLLLFLLLLDKLPVSLQPFFLDVG
jgi:hypothetical protein